MQSNSLGTMATVPEYTRTNTCALFVPALHAKIGGRGRSEQTDAVLFLSNRSDERFAFIDLENLTGLLANLLQFPLDLPQRVFYCALQIAFRV